MVREICRPVVSHFMISRPMASKAINDPVKIIWLRAYDIEWGQSEKMKMSAQQHEDGHIHCCVMSPPCDICRTRGNFGAKDVVKCFRLWGLFILIKHTKFVEDWRHFRYEEVAMGYVRCEKYYRIIGSDKININKILIINVCLP